MKKEALNQSSNSFLNSSQSEYYIEDDEVLQSQRITIGMDPVGEQEVIFAGQRPNPNDLGQARIWFKA